MLTNGIGYNNYNRIQTKLYEDEVSKRLSAQNEAQQNVQKNAQETEQSSSIMDLRLDDIKPRENASIEEISLSLNQNQGFDMKGRESELASLDMQKAVSDMQKDQVLQQYQFFVGDTGYGSANQDGIVVLKN